MSHRAQLGPLPCDVTDCILSSLGEEARFNILPLSKAFSVYFWARLADKYDVESLLGWKKPLAVPRTIKDERALEIVEAVEDNHVLRRWIYGSQSFVRIVSVVGLRVHPVFAERWSPRTVSVGMVIPLPYPETDLEALRRPYVDATACMRVTLDRLPYNMDEFRTAWLVSLAALMLKIPTFSLFAIQDALAAALVEASPKRVNANALMRIFRHPDFDPSAARNAWLRFLTNETKGCSERPIEFLVFHPKFQKRFLTTKLAARFLTCDCRRSMFRSLFASDQAAIERWYDLDLIHCEMQSLHFAVLVAKFSDVIPERDRVTFAFRVVDCPVKNDDELRDMAFETLRTWGITATQLSRWYKDRHGDAYPLKYHHYKTLYENGFFDGDELARLVMEDESTYSVELQVVLSDTGYSFDRHGYGILSTLVDRAIGNPNDWNKKTFEALSARRENGFDAVKFLKYIEETRPDSIDLFRSWTTRKSKRIAKKRKKALSDSSSSEEE
jgi:hypothetical protein